MGCRVPTRGTTGLGTLHKIRKESRELPWIGAVYAVSSFTERQFWDRLLVLQQLV